MRDKHAPVSRNLCTSLKYVENVAGYFILAKVSHQAFSYKYWYFF